MEKQQNGPTVFPWSIKFKKDQQKLIEKVVRIDITFSKGKGKNDALTFYDSQTYFSKEGGLDEDAWKGYKTAFDNYQRAYHNVPIDLLDIDNNNQSWHSFTSRHAKFYTDCGDEVPKTFREAQSDLSARIFKETNNAIHQIIVFPNFAQQGFGSNCIVALSKIISRKSIYPLMAECLRYSYKESLEEFSKLLQEETIKSAKAAIMSRNISHNLGSHVMAYLKQDLVSVEEMLKNGVLMNALPCDKIANEDLEEKEIPYLVGIGRFISYLQERQDYIATVSTDYIPYPSIVNFKDSIYDELNPDYRFKRHPEWAGHQPANILLRNIAKSEGLSRKTLEDGKTQDSNNILIQYRKFNGLKDSSTEKDYKKLRKWNFSLPGGIMGRQAVFSIVENVIRNAAKHGTRRNGANLSLTFDIIDPMEGFPKEDKDFWYPYKVADDKNDLYIVTLTDNIVTDKNRVEDINKILTSPFSGDGFDLAASNKGLKEMVISAAWLRNIHIEKQINDELAPIIKARNTKEGYLQYVFCLPRVKEVALITNRFNKGTPLSTRVTNLMKKHGWSIFSVEEFCKLGNKDYSFIIIDPNLQKEEKDERKPSVIDTIRKCSHNRYYIAAENSDISQHYIKTDLFDKLPEYTKAIKLKAAELELYAQLAGDLNFKIAIADIDEEGSFDEDFVTKSSYVEILNVERYDKKEYKYVFRKHNDTKKQFDKFIGFYQKSKFYNVLAFVEGITGGNSTDRLVRHMLIDDLWAFKQIHAMRTKIAIFDERIFTKVTGYEKTDLTKSTEEGWRNRLDNLNVNDSKKAIEAYIKNHAITIEEDVFLDFLQLQTKEEIISFAETYCPLEKSSKKNDGFISMVYHKKGIDIYTIIEEEDGTFNIWGFVPDENLENDYGKIEKVGYLKIDPSGKEAPSIDMYYEKKYHYLSIHQGLLDKIYKVIDPEKMDLEKKRKVTKELHNEFVICPQTEDDDYLQGLIIHSGRSKPNTKDMPQHQPFVQYSAIENAIFDCKYTLVELLDSACYE